jgi:multisite-specific tRNA:(cytosine-C5)-methyltransferase
LIRKKKSERKRESNDIFELPESKKPRLSADATVEEEELAIPVDADMEPEFTSQSTGKRQGKGRSQKTTTDSGGSFKENPYTFLAPDDPNLLNCM